MQGAVATFMRGIGRHHFDPADFDITFHEVFVPHLDSDFEGYRLVHVSDIHMGHWITPERLAGVVDLVNDQKPDLIAITGDFVSYLLDEVAGAMVASLRQLAPRDATVAVLGNHDHWLGAAAVRRLLHASDVIDLSNTVHTLRRRTANLHIAGVDDVLVGADHLPGVLNKLTEPGAAVLLAHEPDFADVSAASGRFSLQLSGHSHGSQIVLPLRGPLVRGPYFKKYPIGRYDVQGMTLYTTRGLGTHMVRLRINCPPEITVITLHGREKHNE
ncbi:MAG: metallophosphoesterase [Ardenticatenaceae bacterium]|nr:metallophosphoesterase [Ardenticatenaceae bacterium]